MYRLQEFAQPKRSRSRVPEQSGIRRVTGLLEQCRLFKHIALHQTEPISVANPEPLAFRQLGSLLRSVERSRQLSVKIGVGGIELSLCELILAKPKVVHAGTRWGLWTQTNSRGWLRVLGGRRGGLLPARAAHDLEY